MIKFISLSIVLNITCILLVQSIMQLVRTDIFKIDITLYLTILVLLLISFYIGALAQLFIDKKLVYICMPVAIALPILIYSTKENFIINLIPTLLLYVGLFATTDISTNLLKARITVSSRPFIKSLGLYFSLLTASLYYFSYTDNSLIIDGIEKIVLQQMKGINNFGISPAFLLNELVNTKGIVTDVIQNYASFIKPLMTLLIFSVVSFLSTLAWYIYALTIIPISFILEMIGFLKKDIKHVEKTELVL